MMIIIITFTITITIITIIPLDKGEGAVRPIGVGEVLRRIIGKCVMSIDKKDVVEADLYNFVQVRSLAVKPPFMQCTLYLRLMKLTLCY